MILRHGGEAGRSRNEFARMLPFEQAMNSLALLPPGGTASNLDPGNRADPQLPQKATARPS